MRLFNCYNCVSPETGMPGVKFFAELPVCPTCKLDGREPRFKDRVVQCRIIHFDPPHPQAIGAGLNVLACDPTKKIGGLNGVAAMATGEPAVVNCPNCRATDVFKAALAAKEDGPDNVKLDQGGLASAVLA